MGGPPSEGVLTVILRPRARYRRFASWHRLSQAASATGSTASGAAVTMIGDLERPIGQVAGINRSHRLLEVVRVDPAGFHLLTGHHAFVEATPRGIGVLIAVKDLAIARHAWIGLLPQLP